MQVQDALTSRYSCTLLKHREISFQSNYAGRPALHPVYLFIAAILVWRSRLDTRAMRRLCKADMRGCGTVARIECSGGNVSGKHPPCAMRCIIEPQGMWGSAKNVYS